VGNFKCVDSTTPWFRYFHKQEHHYDSAVKRMSVIYHDSLDERDIAVTKGSAETILEICRYEAGGMELTDEDKVKITEMMNTFTDEGLVMVSSTSLTEESTCIRTKVVRTRRSTWDSARLST